MRHNIRRGAALLVAATLCIALINGCQKSVGKTVPLGEVLFFRNLISIPFMVMVASQGACRLKTNRFWAHVRRSMIGLSSMFLVILAIQKLPLAEQQILSYTQPLFIALLSVPFLGETLSLRKRLMIGVGFLGVLIAASGRAGSLHPVAPAPWWAYAAAIVQGAMGALITLQIRDLSKTEHSATITFWQSILMTAFTALTLPFFWVTPSLHESVVLLIIGLLGGMQQILQTEAFASAQVSSIGGFLYCGLIWSAVVGWVFFGELPTRGLIAGGVLIVAAGVWMLRGERPPQRGYSPMAVRR
ncbi:DMT family transporter [Nguyenibacter sp. L1]|uniref:DMT family transporter n=1 Tax=Nguyenibacter sp. L1 TaxID=3049350 RepID=UPI002B481069|nr:DMT family transporter [Nguyenibacter sp. L1]WRH89769.1 DMT family transporter [Nguyenibacter sp. L1]